MGAPCNTVTSQYYKSVSAFSKGAKTFSLDGFILGKREYAQFGKEILDTGSEIILIHEDSKATVVIK